MYSKVSSNIDLYLMCRCCDGREVRFHRLAYVNVDLPTSRAQSFFWKPNFGSAKNPQKHSADRERAAEMRSEGLLRKSNVNGVFHPRRRRVFFLNCGQTLWISSSLNFPRVSTSLSIVQQSSSLQTLVAMPSLNWKQDRRKIIPYPHLQLKRSENQVTVCSIASVYYQAQICRGSLEVQSRAYSFFFQLMVTWLPTDRNSGRSNYNDGRPGHFSDSHFTVGELGIKQ